LVLHGTDNAFVLPKHASSVAECRGETVLTVNSPEELMIVGMKSDRPAVHVSWLQAGHELLQERGSFVLQVRRPTKKTEDDPVFLSGCPVSSKKKTGYPVVLIRMSGLFKKKQDILFLFFGSGCPVYPKKQDPVFDPDVRSIQKTGSRF
jgi:hypothetical protein